MLSNQRAQRPSTLCIAAGKSGGHLIPALQLAQQWHNEHQGGNVVLCTYGTMLDQKIYARYPFINKVQSFSFTTFIARKLWRYPIIAMQAIKATWIAWRLLRTTQAEKVITTGGFVALPVSIAARLLGIPVEVYELNIHPGKAVQALAMLGAKIFAVFNETLKKMPHAVLTDYPIRFTQADIKSPSVARLELAQRIPSAIPLTDNRKTVFLCGGSQGSTYLNELMIKFVIARPDLHNSMQIIHQSGTVPDRFIEVYTKYIIPHLVFDFHPAIAACYQAADVVICRAGAGTLFELKFFNRPAVIIPLVAASTGHQGANARAISAQMPELFTTMAQHMLETNLEAFFDLVAKYLRT